MPVMVDNMRLVREKRTSAIEKKAAELNNDVTTQNTSLTTRSNKEINVMETTLKLYRVQKFVTDRDLNYDSPTCGFVLKELNMGDNEAERKLEWERCKHTVKKRIDSLRNQHSTAIKTAIMGK